MTLEEQFRHRANLLCEAVELMQAIWESDDEPTEDECEAAITNVISKARGVRVLMSIEKAESN